MFVAEIAGLAYNLDAEHYRSFILVGMGAPDFNQARFLADEMERD